MTVFGDYDSARQPVAQQPGHRSRHRHGRFADGNQANLVPGAQVIARPIHQERFALASNVTANRLSRIGGAQRRVDERVEGGARIGAHGARHDA